MFLHKPDACIKLYSSKTKVPKILSIRDVPLHDGTKSFNNDGSNVLFIHVDHFTQGLRSLFPGYSVDVRTNQILLIISTLTLSWHFSLEGEGSKGPYERLKHCPRPTVASIPSGF